MTLLDYVYENVKDSANNVLDMVDSLGEFVLNVLIGIVVYGTLPLWLIPYLIIKKRKEKGEVKGGEENMSNFYDWLFADMEDLIDCDYDDKSEVDTE